MGVDASHPTGGVVLTVEPPAPCGEQFLPYPEFLTLLIRSVCLPLCALAPLRLSALFTHLACLGRAATF